MSSSRCRHPLAEMVQSTEQWGEWRPYRTGDGNRADGHINPDGTFHTTTDPGWLHEGGAVMQRPGKKAAGRTLDGRIWDQYSAQMETV